MSNYNVNLTLENIRIITVMFLDILIMWLVLYYALRIIRGSSKTVQIFKGIFLIVIIDIVAKFIGLKTVAYLTDTFINWGFLAIIIIFQPEIRSLLERLGKSNVFSRINTLTGNEKENLVDQIVTAAMLLSKDQTGALISIEQAHSLDDFVATGTKLNSDVTAELLTSIFVTSTPLHDGAVIIQGDKIACASAYFPPTNLDLPSRYGARHRAAIGISEITDAVTIVVSEETGAISVTEGGKIFTVNQKQLRDYLLRVICGEETEVRVNGNRQRKAFTDEPGRSVIIADDKEKDKDASQTGYTGVLSRLALKHQEEKKPEKIQTESVIPASSIKDEKMEELAEEASEIKLPHKKQRPVPSYPHNDSAERFAKQKAEEEARLKAEEVRRARQAEEERKAAEEQAAREKAEAEAARKAQEEALKRRETAAVPRMTPEEVRAARQKAMDRLAGKKEEEKPEPAAPVQEDEKKYDTTKLDLSRLMGLNEDLDKTLSIIDAIPDEKHTSGEKKNGGDQE